MCVCGVCVPQYIFLTTQSFAGACHENTRLCYIRYSHPQAGRPSYVTLLSRPRATACFLGQVIHSYEDTNNIDEQGTLSGLWKVGTSLHKAGALEANSGATVVV